MKFEVIGLYEALTATPNSKWNYTVVASKDGDKALKWWKIEIRKFQEIIREDKYEEIHAYLLDMATKRRDKRIRIAKCLFEEDGMFGALDGRADDAFQQDANVDHKKRDDKDEKPVSQDDVFDLLKGLGGDELDGIVKLS